MLKDLHEDQAPFTPKPVTNAQHSKTNLTLTLTGMLDRPLATRIPSYPNPIGRQP